MNLYKDIIEEMENQGHSVTFFEDKSLKGDIKNLTFSTWFGLRKVLWKNKIKRYWQEAISSNVILSYKYDVLFVLTGYSIDTIIINHLKNISPEINTVFYTWDTCNYYTFDKFLPLFDKSYLLSCLFILIFFRKQKKINLIRRSPSNLLSNDSSCFSTDLCVLVICPCCECCGCCCCF